MRFGQRAGAAGHEIAREPVRSSILGGFFRWSIKAKSKEAEKSQVMSIDPDLQVSGSTHALVTRTPAARNLRFPSLYGAIILAGSLDIWLTGLLLALGAAEANPLANAVLHAHGFTGMVVFKYLAVGAVILACEFVASRNRRVAQGLAATLVALHAAPLPWSAGLLVQAV